VTSEQFALMDGEALEVSYINHILAFMPKLKTIRAALERESEAALEMLRSAGLPTPERRT